MERELSVDFLKEKYRLHPTEKKQKKQRKFTIGFIAFFLILGAIGLLSSGRTAEVSGSTDGQIFNPFRGLQLSGDRAIEGEDEDRIDVLLLGIGGSGHEGPELTDTIILASLEPSTNSVSMLSIPRDMAVNIPGYGWRKVNHVNALAEIEEAGSGLNATREVLSEVLGQSIEYAVKVDFSGFEDFIDAIGGLDVYVERSFTDPSFPTDDFLTEVITFEEGWQNMNGETALKFARSRKGDNGEGSDFARAVRQQKVITAVKDKLLSTQTLLNPGRLSQLAQLVNKHVESNLSIFEMIRLARFAPEVDSNSIRQFVLDDAPGSPLFSANLNGAYVLLPKDDTWNDLHILTAAMFSNEAPVFSSKTSITPPPRAVRIKVLNGTAITGLASEVAYILASSGFTVTSVGNAPENTETTLLVDETNGNMPTELQILREYFNASLAQTEEGWLKNPDIIPDELITDTDESIDFTLILGQDSAYLLN